MLTTNFIDQWHNVLEEMPKPNMQLHIECDYADVGGAGMLGADGKWYWTWNGKPDSVCSSTVTRWCYMRFDDETRMPVGQAERRLLIALNDFCLASNSDGNCAGCRFVEDTTCPISVLCGRFWPAMK